jgi:hypothetical protein
MDGELGASEQSVVSSHVFGCSRCTTELRSLRAVDVLLQRPPAVTLPHVDTSLLSRRRRLLPKPILVILIILALAAIAAGGTAIGLKVAQILRTDKNVETQPAESYPGELHDQMREGSKAQMTPPSGIEWQIWSVPDVEAALEARLLQPTYLPEGYEVVQRYAPSELDAEILYLADDGTSIYINESNHKLGNVDRPPVPPSAAEQVDIGGHLGIYIRGGWLQEEPEGQPEWNPDLVHSVIFDSGALVIEIDAPVSVERDDLIAVAVSMK